MNRPSFLNHLSDRALWARHRIAAWLFSRARDRASAWMMGLLVVPAWLAFLCWLVMISWWVSDTPIRLMEPLWFALLVIAVAAPYEAICRWWRLLNAPLERDEAYWSWALLNKHVDLSTWKSDPLLGAWHPCLQLEAWMVSWAFDGVAVREAQAACMRASSATPRGKAPLRRL